MSRNILIILLLASLFPCNSQVKQSSNKSIDSYNKKNNNIESVDDFPINENYSMWSEDCDVENGDQLLYFGNSKIIFTVNSMHFICAIISQKISKNKFDIYLAPLDDDPSSGAFFSSEDIPGGKKFENFSDNEPIAKIVYIDHSKIEFTWLGFYDTVNKKRVLLKDIDPANAQNTPKILKNCVEEDDLQQKSK